MISSAWLLSLALCILGSFAYDYDACECFDVSLTSAPTVDSYGNICYNYFICQSDHAPEECPQLSHVTLDRGDTSTCDSGGWRFIKDFITSDGYSLYNGGSVKGIRFDMQFNKVEYNICFDAAYVSGTQTNGQVLYTDLEGVQTECPVSNVIPGFCAPSPTPDPTWPTPHPTWPTPKPTWPTPYPTTKSPTPKPTWPTPKPTWPTKKPTPWPTSKYSSSVSKSKSKSGSSDKKKSGSSDKKKKSGSSSGKKKSGSSSGKKKKSSSGSKKKSKKSSSSGDAAYAWAAPLDAQDHDVVKNEPNQPIAVEPFQPWGFYLIVVLISVAVQLTGCAAFYLCFMRKKVLVDAQPLTSGYAISRKVADDSDAEIEVE